MKTLPTGFSVNSPKFRAPPKPRGRNLIPPFKLMEKVSFPSHGGDGHKCRIGAYVGPADRTGYARVRTEVDISKDEVEQWTNEKRIADRALWDAECGPQGKNSAAYRRALRRAQRYENLPHRHHVMAVPYAVLTSLEKLEKPIRRATSPHRQAYPQEKLRDRFRSAERGERSHAFFFDGLRALGFKRIQQRLDKPAKIRLKFKRRMQAHTERPHPLCLPEIREWRAEQGTLHGDIAPPAWVQSFERGRRVPTIKTDAWERAVETQACPLQILYTNHILPVVEDLLHYTERHLESECDTGRVVWDALLKQMALAVDLWRSNYAAQRDSKGLLGHGARMWPDSNIFLMDHAELTELCRTFARWNAAAKIVKNPPPKSRWASRY